MNKGIEPLKLIFSTDGISPYAIGGMARHSRLLIEEIAKSKEVNIIVIHPHKVQIFDKELNIKEIIIEGINLSKNYLLESYRYSKRVYSILEKYPDYIIYSQGFSVSYKIKELSSRLIINPHGLEPYQPISSKDFLMGLPFRIIFHYLFNHSARVISLGGRLTDILKANIKNVSKIVVLPNGINIPTDSNLTERFISNPEKLKVLFIGRFAGNKGINILLEAVKELNAEGYAEKIVYYLAGSGPLYKYYINNYNYKNVNYPGFVLDEQLTNLYKSSDLFVLPTLYEGMPTVVLEAMSYRLPIIVSNTGATPEMVDSSNGYLIERNNVGALKKAIISFYNLSFEQKRRLSENSYNKVKNYFTWGYIAEKYIELFRVLGSINAQRN